jgi:hypothetical protein
VLATLLERLDVDVCFLRHNDQHARVSKVVAERPPRPYRPDPDPLAPTPSSRCATLVGAKLPFYGYVSRTEEARLITSPSVAVAPLLSGALRQLPWPEVEAGSDTHT